VLLIIGEPFSAGLGLTRSACVAEQGTADDELPEQLLGAVRLHTLDYLQVPHLDPTLAAAAAVQSA